MSHSWMCNSAAGGVRPTSVLRAEALQKRKCNRRARWASDQRSRSTRSTSGAWTGGGSGSLGSRGWNARYARQPESRIHLVAGGRLQTAAAQLLSSRYARQCPGWKDRHCSTVNARNQQTTTFSFKASFSFYYPSSFIDVTFHSRLFYTVGKLCIKFNIFHVSQTVLSKFLC